MINKHLVKLIHWAIDEVLSASGDGDTFILNKHYNVEELKESTLEALSTHSISKLWKFEELENSWSLGHDQEWLLIYPNTIGNEPDIPPWAQCVIRL